MGNFSDENKDYIGGAYIMRYEVAIKFIDFLRKEKYISYIHGFYWRNGWEGKNKIIVLLDHIK